MQFFLKIEYFSKTLITFNHKRLIDIGGGRMGYKRKHCASSSLKEICVYYKYPISEGMTFGLSSGLYWGYIPYSSRLSRLIVLRKAS